MLLCVCACMYVHLYMCVYMYMCVYACICVLCSNNFYTSVTVAVVTSETSAIGEGPPQQDGGDIGASVIEHLPAGVSAQCELDINVQML